MAFVYFAYGSNMCEGWLKAPDRAPSAAYVAVAHLQDHALRWHKRSKDGSGKADAWYTGYEHDVVWGTLFTIADVDKPQLEKREGVGQGYHEVQVTVRRVTGIDCRAVTYVADPDYIDDSLKPYTWYKQIVVEGARQHRLPLDYVTTVDAVASQDDPKGGRAAKYGSLIC